MKISTESGYFMEDPREKYRLRAKVNAEQWVDKTLAPMLHGGEKILDVGCGPGELVKAIAERFVDTEVIGLEKSDDRYTAAAACVAQIQNASIVQGDAMRMPMDDGDFDLAYTRFMLEYLPQPAKVVAEMARVCRPGGKLVLQDLDGQLLWHDGMDVQAQADVETIVDHLRSTGFDPFIGRKLYRIARQVGLCDIKVAAEPYHFYPGKIDSESDRHWELKLEIALPQMEVALGSRVRAMQLKEQLLEHLRSDKTFTYSMLFTVVGRVPSAEVQET